MGKLTDRRKATKRKKADTRLDITPERLQHGEIVSLGMARKMVPVIVTLHEAKRITDRQYAALAYYRDQASLADHSPIKDSVGSLGVITGGGNGPGVALTSAKLETARLEANLGSLWPITRAIAVDDMSLTGWAIHTSGGIERYKGDRCVGIVPRNPKAVDMALLELKFAASRMME